MQNSILDKNLNALKRRFPELAQKLCAYAENFSGKSTGSASDVRSGAKQSFIPPDVIMFEAKNGEISASYKDILLHSQYNPSAEAERTVSTQAAADAHTIVFFGASLGYGPCAASRIYKAQPPYQDGEKTVVVIEPDMLRLLWAFSFIDWQDFFALPSCVLLLEADEQTAVTVLEHYGFDGCAVIAHKAATAHNQNYFLTLHALIEKNKNKQSINERTFKKFSHLWLLNTCKNSVYTAQLDGIIPYKNKAGSLDACILAAGAGLDAVLPFLKELKKRMLLICVDTALRALLKHNVQPHFIVLADPQYWNARHISGLHAKESILISEIAAYPSVFRFDCKKIVLCSSFFPPGAYIENLVEQKGSLAAGGSVASSAWDFARFIGCTNIYAAGLDLGYSEGKTHAKGSTFEEAAHCVSTKLQPAETKSAGILYANPRTNGNTSVCDYTGKPLLTDARMSLYAWWFERTCALYGEVHTYNLSANACAIPGIAFKDVHELLNLPEKENDIHGFCAIKTGTAKTQQEREKKLKAALNDLYKALCALYKAGSEALELCGTTCTEDSQYEQILQRLDELDKAIKENKASSIAKLLSERFSFEKPLRRRLISSALCSSCKIPYSQAAQKNIEQSKPAYRILTENLREYMEVLAKYMPAKSATDNV